MTNTSFSRREFIKLGSAALGGLAIGFELPGCGGNNWQTQMADRAERSGEFMPNAWVVIRPDNAIIYQLDRVEMGQGTMTSHAMLVAEELEVKPERIQVVHALAHRSYDNPDPQLGFQVTGGSTSVHTSWVPLRRAAATAREMLRRAAAEQWGVPIDSCRAEEGDIVHAPTGRRSTYGSLASRAAHLPIPEPPPLKAPAEFRYIGRSRTRLDARTKVDGSAIYGIDVKRPNMLTAVVVRCPVRGGSVRSFDATRARADSGVVEVYEVPTGVAVVAKSYWRARRAAEKLQITWDEGALAGLDSDGLRAEYRARAEKPAKRVRNDGDVEDAFSNAARTLSAVYEVPYLAHATMEPMNATVHVRDDRCEIWAPTQSPGLTREAAHQILGYAHEDIVVHTTFLGGGFGRRLVQDFVREAIYVARRFKQPVKLVWSREDDFANDFYRPMTYNVLRAGLDEKGSLRAWFHRIVAQSIVSDLGREWIPAVAPNGVPQSVKALLARTAVSFVASNTIVDPTSVESASNFAYAIPNLAVEYAALGHKVPVGPWRGVGNTENVFVVESFIDELAHAAKQDPYLFRRALLSGSPRHLATLDLVAQTAGWQKQPPPGLYRGIAFTKCFDSYCAQVVEVRRAERGIRVERVVCAIDCGLVVNPDLVKAQIESGIVFGLSAALKQAITFKNGRVEQTNFHQFPLLRMHEAPAIEVVIAKSNEEPTGVGEPGVPPVAPALANALFAATGQRIRRLPIELELKES